MKTLIKNKIDRLVESGEVVDRHKDGYSIGKIYAYTDSDYFPDFYVKNTELDSDEAEEIYLYLQSIMQQQFIEYLKGD